jgi:histidinol dehydrogenase
MSVERLEWDGQDAATYAAGLRRVTSSPPELEATVAAIIAEVRKGGEGALRRLTARYDATTLSSAEIVLRAETAEIDEAREGLDPGLVAALEMAARNIERVARAELEASGPVRAELPQGQTVSVVSSPVESAGVYVPGGGGAYPSTVLMGCVPARVAGVDRVVVASPPGPDGVIPPVVMAACSIAGVHELYAIGGAQAIAALAYGCESIEPVDLIVGPGNAYVNAAKKAVIEQVGIDGIAGPSELVVILDDQADTEWIALDLAAQAEHGPGGLLAAISADAQALAGLAGRLERLASERPSASGLAARLVHAPDLSAAVELADALAPEHLELAVKGADELLAADRVAGAVFFGPAGAVAFGDYAAGSNHILPTGGAARFGRPLGVDVFRRRTSIVEMPPEAVTALAPRVATLARAEGFDVHGESAEARTEG